VALTPGTRLGPYEITARIGVGGMGEVWCATDTHLDRQVAVKILPDAFAQDPDRLARFEREAKTLASLNHPNIAIIHGLEKADGIRALVMELVEGPTLADRIAQGPIPIDEALPIAKQIAEALEAAHEQGIIHRDLKPANVKVREDGTVKVLDFGLAKAMEPPAAMSPGLSQSPTITTPTMTQAGLILGTAAYMSPEQARGKTVDKRADIWAFGVLVYELVTGIRPFKGEDVSETVAAVIKEEPQWGAVPLRFRRLIKDCLEKNPAKRLRDIGDAWRLIEDAPQVETADTRHRLLPWLAGGIAVITGLVLALIAVIYFRERPSSSEPVRFQIALPEDISLRPLGGFALSPDGRNLVFAGVGPDNINRLWLRVLSSLEVKPLEGTENANGQGVFWSPDSRFVAFNASGRLKKIAITGGPAQTICDVTGVVAGGSWNRDGVIIFGNNPGVIMRVDAIGGVATPVTADSPLEILHILPKFLPDGRHFIYLRITSPDDKTGVYIGSLDSQPEAQTTTPLLLTHFEVAFIPAVGSGAGRLLYRREGTLMAQRFDDRTLALSGEATPIADRLGSFLSSGFFSASGEDVLVYRTGGASQESQLTWVDRDGNVVGTVGEPYAYTDVALSNKGTQAAVSRYDIDSGVSDVWLVDLATAASTRFTFGRGFNGAPVWSPDDTRIVFQSSRDGAVADLYTKPTNGAQEQVLLLTTPGFPGSPTSWSRNDVLLVRGTDPKTKDDLLTLLIKGDRSSPPLAGQKSEAATLGRFLTSDFNERQGRFSPDGRFVAYQSDETGRDEIYVREFSTDSSGRRWGPVSQGGGRSPHWRADGRELFYLSADGTVTAVDVTAVSGFQWSTAKVLFKLVSPLFGSWDVAPDGKRFLVAAPARQNDAKTPFTVVLNWAGGLDEVAEADGRTSR
jgi:serine/threonine protein kinase/Tol biopolymer transport system component